MAKLDIASEELVRSFDINLYDQKVRQKLKSCESDAEELAIAIRKVCSYSGKERIVDELKNSQLSQYLGSIDKIPSPIKKLIVALDQPLPQSISYQEYRDAKEKLFREVNQFVTLTVNSSNYLAEYENEVTKLLEEYEKIRNKTVPLFCRNIKSKVENTSDQLMEVIIRFINLAERFVDLNPIINPEQFKKYRNRYKESVCRQCGSRFTVTMGDNLTCSVCGYIFTVLEEESSYKDMSRVSISTKYVYDAVSTFTDIISRFQGSKHKQITDKLLEDVSNYLHSNGFINRSYKEIDFKNDEIRKEIFKNLTKAQLRKTLRETKNSAYYSDLNYLFSYLTGTDMIDISHIEKKLIEDYKKLYDEFRMTRVGKRNMRKGYFMLYKLLQRRGFNCSRRDFLITRTQDKLNEYEAEYQRLAGAIGWT